ncbi:hypothetical protein B0H14DRAFT_3592402 [Mycena olivaceomarginata]|nr:hypothetical protein B0H14DRAFT_3592402 [Mycena olivaceomarginata]
MSSDALSPHVTLAGEALFLAPASDSDEESESESQAYLSAARIIALCKAHDVTLLHPGYDFLSENAAFTQAVLDAGIIWLGPTPSVIKTMGFKHLACEVAMEAGVVCVPASTGLVTDEKAVQLITARIGFPIMLKASGGLSGTSLLRGTSRFRFSMMMWVIWYAWANTNAAFSVEVVPLGGGQWKANFPFAATQHSWPLIFVDQMGPNPTKRRSDFRRPIGVKTGVPVTFTGFGSKCQGGRCSGVGGAVSWTKWDQTPRELVVSSADRSGENSLPATFTGFWERICSATVAARRAVGFHGPNGTKPHRNSLFLCQTDRRLSPGFGANLQRDRAAQLAGRFHGPNGTQTDPTSLLYLFLAILASKCHHFAGQNGGGKVLLIPTTIILISKFAVSTPDTLQWCRYMSPSFADRCLEKKRHPLPLSRIQLSLGPQSVILAQLNNIWVDSSQWTLFHLKLSVALGLRRRRAPHVHCDHGNQLPPVARLELTNLAPSEEFKSTLGDVSLSE